MNKAILSLLDFDQIDALLEGFNKSTGFVTAIIDLEGNVLSKSGWRQMCTRFHRIHPETSKKCTISNTELANKMAEGETYHFYKCLNGLVDVAVPIVIDGVHIANLFSGQFFPMESRNDVGQLWENYMISERIKYLEYKKMPSNTYFWRTYDQQEIDWVEEREGSLFGYEFKWKESKTKTPSQWKKAYPDATFKVIHMHNFEDWLS